MVMRTLSLWQPWASLVALGKKKYETRDWPMQFTGRLAIHAAKHPFNPKEYDAAWLREFYHELAADEIDLGHLKYGYVVCVVDVPAPSVRTEEIRDGLGAKERMYGNYTDNRFATRLANVRALSPALPFKGKQGFFDVPL
jgi:hypothetical protein